MTFDDTTTTKVTASKRRAPCIKCGGPTVAASIKLMEDDNGSRIKRRRECMECGNNFVTYEWFRGLLASEIDVAEKALAVATALSKKMKPEKSKVGEMVKAKWLLDSLEKLGRDRALTDFESLLLEKCIRMQG